MASRSFYPALKITSFDLITIFFLSFFAFTFTCCEQSSVPALYVFGDSLLDVGNNNYIEGSLLKANYPHNGIDYPSQESTGRFSNGKNAADLIAEKARFPTSPPPYLSNTSDIFLEGVSFASGGSGLFNSTGQGFLRKTLSLSQQVSYYKALHKRLVRQLGALGAQQHLSKSLFAVLTGSNDVFAYFENNDIRKSKTSDKYINEMISILQPLMKRLHSLGARKFVVPGLAAVGCTPAQRFKRIDEECNADMNSMAKKYNQKLTEMLAEFESKFMDEIKYTYIDTYTVLSGIIENPSTYGFCEVKAACCGLGILNAGSPCMPLAIFCPDRTDHIFWDIVHPTQAAASVIVNILYNGSQPNVKPINLQQLIAL